MDREKKDSYTFKGVGLTAPEKKVGRKKFKEYLSIYPNASYSDLQLLESLVYREITQERYKLQVKTLAENEDIKKKTLVPSHLLDAIDENEKAILDIKDKLGLFENKEQNDAFQHIQTLKKKFNIWKEQNQGSRTLICPECGKVIMLRIRTDAWEAQKHKFFRDRILTNEHLIKLFEEGKITKEDVAKVLGVSTDYVTWILKKFYSPK